MKKSFDRILVIALIVVMTLEMVSTALAAGTGAMGPGIVGDSFGTPDTYVDYGSTITFKDGGEHDLTAQTGTTKNANGDVVITGVSGIIPENRVPAVAGMDVYYDQVAWATKDKDGNRLFKSDDLITRAEISTVIWRINNYYKAQ